MARLLSITLALLFASVSSAQPAVAGEFLEKKSTQVVAQDPAPSTAGTAAGLAQTPVESPPAPEFQSSQQQAVKESPVAPAATLTVAASSAQGQAPQEKATVVPPAAVAVAAKASAAPPPVFPLAAKAPPATVATAPAAAPVQAAAAPALPVIRDVHIKEEAYSAQSWNPWRVWQELSALESLLAGLTFASMVKAMCMAGNILVQISPYPQVQRWELRGCTGESDAAPYVSIAFGGWQWCYYGFFAYFITTRSGFLILVHSNFLGAILGTYYIITYFRNCRNPEMLQNLQKYLAAVVALILLQVCALTTLPVERALFMTGLVSSFCSFVGAISMLFCLPAVIRSKDSRAIPGPLVTANLASAVVWCICGLMLSDPMIAAPNVVCCLSSLLCLYLKLVYPHPDEPGREEDVDVPRPVKQRVWKQFGFAEATEATPLAVTNHGDCGTGGTF